MAGSTINKRTKTCRRANHPDREALFPWRFETSCLENVDLIHLTQDRSLELAWEIRTG
jgi:hypothetical protein